MNHELTLVKKRKYNDIDDDVDEDLNQKYVLQSPVDDIYIYNVGNEINFTSPITTESIQKFIKIIQKLVNTHLEKHKNDDAPLKISYTIDSGGGGVTNVLKATDFINIVKNKHKNIEFISIITGSAASAATILSLTAHRRLMTKNAFAMIHELSGGYSGQYTFMSSRMKYINQLHDKLVGIYVDATKKSKEEIENLMNKETWFNAEEYLAMGFIDEII